jgi:triacylglycerol lipase
MLWHVNHEPPPPILIWHAMLDGVFLVGWHAEGLRVRASRRRTQITHANAPVVMLPGVYESPHFLDPLATSIRATGRPVHSVAALNRNRGRIADSAVLVRSYLEEHGLQNVTIVAHSKGGLIGKQLMVAADTSARINSMIAITTPFAGSRYAKHAPTRVLRDFSPTDQTVRELSANLEANKRVISIFGPLDPQIPDGSRLPGARNVLLRTPGHFRPLGDPQLHRLLTSILSAELASGTR